VRNTIEAQLQAMMVVAEAQNFVDSFDIFDSSVVSALEKRFGHCQDK
jgi:hypothetical protein